MTRKVEAPDIYAAANRSTDLRPECLYTHIGRGSQPVLHRRQGEERIIVRADEPEVHRFDDLRSPAVQHAAECRRSRRPANTDDRQVATALVTVEFQKDRVAGFTVNPNLWLGTR